MSKIVRVNTFKDFIVSLVIYFNKYSKQHIGVEKCNVVKLKISTFKSVCKNQIYYDLRRICFQGIMKAKLVIIDHYFLIMMKQ